MSVTTIIDEMVERIVREFNPEKIILFGSHARDDANASSDVDLLIVMPDGTDRKKSAIAAMRALGDLPVAKDIVVTTPDEISRRGDLAGTVLRPALREGRILFERP
jgi:uncharacterized protein